MSDRFSGPGKRRWTLCVADDDDGRSEERERETRTANSNGKVFHMLLAKGPVPRPMQYTRQPLRAGGRDVEDHSCSSVYLASGL